MNETIEKPAESWWGRFTLGIGERGLWHVGPLRLALARGRREWAVEYQEKAEPGDAGFFECPTASTLEGPSIVRSRYAFAEAPETVWVRPALADRAVVIYLEHPFHSQGVGGKLESR